MVTTRIASVGQAIAHAPTKVHFSTSLETPKASAGVASPYSTSKDIASTGHNCSHKVHAAQTSGSLTDKVAPLASIKSPGQASTQVLHPIHLLASRVNSLISLELVSKTFFDLYKW